MSIFKEAGFPAHYREAEVGRIMSAVYRLRSIAITGLAGMGKSNVVRFIVSHPQVKPRYLKERANDYAFVHVDCTGLADSVEAEILGEIAAQLHRDGLAAGGLPLPNGSGNPRSSLKEHILGVPPTLNLALVLDGFDEAAARMGRPFFNYLAHLRNARPRGNLSYIFVTRRPMGHLHELHELLDDSCTIGPLSGQDALDAIRRDEARLGCVFGAAQRNLLLACSGGHPGFLKNASELLAGGEIDVNLPGPEVARQLLRSEKIKNLCEELWNDLSPDEHGVLLNIAGDVPLSLPIQAAAAKFLAHNGILVKEKGKADATIFCPLFAAFVREVKSGMSGAVRITAVFPNQALIETPGGKEQVALAPRLFALLLALGEARGKVLPSDEIIARVYGDDEAAGVTYAALSQLVKRLRGVLDRRARRLANDPAYTCVETIRDVGYRLNG
jgi:DNA-binding winged helix-turn-helix (wHTH) protein